MSFHKPSVCDLLTLTHSCPLFCNGTWSIQGMGQMFWGLLPQLSFQHFGQLWLTELNCLLNCLNLQTKATPCFINYPMVLCWLLQSLYIDFKRVFHFPVGLVRDCGQTSCQNLQACFLLEFSDRQGRCLDQRVRSLDTLVHYAHPAKYYSSAWQLKLVKNVRPLAITWSLEVRASAGRCGFDHGTWKVQSYHSQWFLEQREREISFIFL